MFVDGRFDYWTASSVTLTTGDTYVGPTMWRGSAGTGGAGTVSQHSLSGDAGQDQTDTNALACLRLTQTTASTGTFTSNTPAQILQRIENVKKFSGRSVTVQVKARLVSGAGSIIGVAFRQNFGSGGDTSVISDKQVNWKLTGNFVRFSVRIDVPSMVSKTTGSNHFLNVGFMTSGEVGVIDFVEAQIERCSPNSSSDLNGKGGAPTAYEWRGEPLESARVAWFYQQDFGQAYTGAFNSSSGGFFVVPFSPMRANPTISISGTFTLYTGSGGTAVSGASLTTNYANASVAFINFSLAGTAGWGMFIVGAAGASVARDCRL